MIGYARTLQCIVCCDAHSVSAQGHRTKPWAFAVLRLMTTLNLDHCHDRQLGRLCTLENSPDIEVSLVGMR